MAGIVRIDDEVIDTEYFIRTLKLTGQFEGLIEQLVRDQLTVRAAVHGQPPEDLLLGRGPAVRGQLPPGMVPIAAPPCTRQNSTSNSRRSARPARAASATAAWMPATWCPMTS